MVLQACALPTSGHPSQPARLGTSGQQYPEGLAARELSTAPFGMRHEIYGSLPILNVLNSVALRRSQVLQSGGKVIGAFPAHTL